VFCLLCTPHSFLGPAPPQFQTGWGPITRLWLRGNHGTQRRPTKFSPETFQWEVGKGPVLRFRSGQTWSYGWWGPVFSHPEEACLLHERMRQVDTAKPRKTEGSGFVFSLYLKGYIKMSSERLKKIRENRSIREFQCVSLWTTQYSKDTNMRRLFPPLVAVLCLFQPLIRLGRVHDFKQLNIAMSC
jgi:hypothetical protein